ncbi:MAG: hybrid sensor histidine kinase/response regulator [Polyangiaceae bacterium]|nr:hybrid sensor histidine kinase/response regulator [Polyangiaceae bacterium]
MSQPLQLLLIEDSEDDAALLLRELKRVGFAVTVTRIETEAELLDALENRAFELVLCDYTLPTLDAPRALEIVQASGRDVPFVIVSGTIGEERAVESMRAGARDFILKDRLARLGPAVRRELTESQARQEKARMREQLQQSEAVLRRSEKLRALGEMAAGITHDLKNLLAPLSLHLQLVERGLRNGAPKDDLQGSVVEMKQILDRGIRTIERLRAFSRQAPERKAELIDLRRLAQEAAEVARPRMASNQNALSTITHELGDAPEVWAQADEVLAAIVNLVVNAIDAMPKGGAITIRTGEERCGGWIEVEDTGPGMPPEVEQRVFEPFFSTKGADGTGLGLAMVYACMMRHGGAVSLKTAPGEGARFRLWFPPPSPDSIRT